MSQPDQISIQHILVSFDETQVKAKRTKAEAEALAAELLKKAQTADDFSAMVHEHSDDPIQPDDPQPGVYNLLNHDVKGQNFQEFMMTLNTRAGEKEQELVTKMEAGQIDQAALESTMNTFIEELRAEADRFAPSLPHPRSAMVSAFGDVGFDLAVGEIGLATFDADDSPFGWHIIKRLA